MEQNLELVVENSENKLKEIGNIVYENVVSEIKEIYGGILTMAYGRKDGSGKGRGVSGGGRRNINTGPCKSGKGPGYGRGGGKGGGKGRK